MSLTSRQRRNYHRSVEHRIEHQQLARQQEAREAQVTTADQFERDRELSRITISVYGVMPISDVPHYLRNIGLNDVCKGNMVQHPNAPLPPVLSTRKR